MGMKIGKCLAAMAFMPSLAFGIEVDGVAAVVGTDMVLKSDVAGEMKRIGLTDSSRYNEILNEMIDRRLILKAAKEEKVTLEEWVVENRVREIIERHFGGNRNNLIEMLGSQRISYPEWYSRMKEDMIIGAMRWRIVNNTVTASPQDMQREYNEHPERYSKDNTISISVIMLRPEEIAKREEINAKLKDSDFPALGGKQYNDIKPSEVFKPELCSKIEKLKVGEIGEWIELGGWSFLFRKDAMKEGHKLTFEEAYEKIEENVKEEKAKDVYTRWMNRLREDTYIKICE